ncbi:hypothetical protein RND81_02G016600 [Saponaria officinalis]|uniref:DUF295 domain-containing protein n=1 Tax=Saponaria officinalis TaxID=3572 RepID=A0AAW1MQ14_SAPOF
MSRRGVVWSELQPELLTLIAERLGTRTDTFNFRLVCKQWRTSASFCVRSPRNHLSSLFPFEFSIIEYETYTKVIKHPAVLVPNAVYVIRSMLNSAVDPWLCTLKELSPGKLEAHSPDGFYRGRSPIAPDNLNLSLFKVTEVLRFYTIKFLDSPNGFGTFKSLDLGRVDVSKVLLIADPNCKTNPTFDDYNVVLLINDGILLRILGEQRTIDKITYPCIKMYDDVVSFKGKIYAIDRKGRLYTAGHKSMTLQIIVKQPVGEGSGSDRKKRLVVSRFGELFLVHRCPPYMKGTFKLYKLNGKADSWDEVDGIGNERILIVTSDGCFFVETKDFPGRKGNCIVFRKGHFLGYSSCYGADQEIFRPLGGGSVFAVFHFGTGDCVPADSHLFWPPPTWLSSDTSLFKSVSVGEIEILRDFCNGVTSEWSKEAEASEAMLAMKNTNNAKRGPIIIDIDSFPDIIPEDSENVSAQETFQGVTVCARLVPVLDKIWKKYGNVIQGHAVSSNSLLTWALESLAKIVIILQTNSSQSFSDSQAAFLRATLKDLRHFHVRLDWLVPYLDTVLVPENSKKGD